MSLADTFIPIDRRLALVQDQPLPDRAVGAVLFVDISGFTKTADGLQRVLGPQRGADELIRRVNRLFSVLIDQAHRYGGSVVSFSGDAITCWFDDAPLLPTPIKGARRATACALAMQSTVSELDDADQKDAIQHSFGVKISVVAGSVRRFAVGSPQIQTIDVLAGGLLDRSAAAEHLLQPGEVIVGSEILGQFGDQIAIGEWRSGAKDGEQYILVTGLTSQVEDSPWPALPEVDPAVTRQWLLPPVNRLIERGAASFLAEFRPAVALFLNFAGIDYDRDDKAGEKLDQFVRWVQAVLQRYDGYLLQVTVGDKGSYCLASIGATLTQEDDSVRSLAAARALLKPPENLSYIKELSAGISWGTMLKGGYGGQQRRAFSIQGSETNLAARLMSAAEPGQILVTSPIAASAQHQFTFRDLGALQLKGLAEPQALFAVEARIGERPGSEGNAFPQAPLVGRQEEVAIFRQRLQDLEDGQGGTLVFEGEAGIGKTHLILSFLEECKTAGKPVLLGSGDAIERAGPYHAWRPIFRDLLQVSSDEELGIVRQKIESLLPEGAGETEINRVLDYALAPGKTESERTESLDDESHADMTRELLAKMLINSLEDEGTLILMLDNAQWLDSASWALLSHVHQTMSAMLIVIAWRPPTDEVRLPKEIRVLLAAAETHRFQLPVLSRDDIVAMVAYRLGVIDLPEPVVKFVIDRAGGHPFFSQEIAFALLDAGIIRIEEQECLLVRDTLDELDFPVTVQGVVGSRIDRMGEAAQLTLKVASVIGLTFSFDTLYDIHPLPDERDEVHEHLSELARLDIVLAENPGQAFTYVFKHAIIQEIAYSRLVFSQRQQLHRAVAEWLEQAHAPNLTPHFSLLAHHWRQAAEAQPGGGETSFLVSQALHYAEKSGAQSLQNSAYREAIDFFSNALGMARSHTVNVDWPRRAAWLQGLGEAYYRWGQWTEARDYLGQAAALYGACPPTGRFRLVGGILGQLLIQVRNRLWPNRYVGRAAAPERPNVLRVADMYRSLSEIAYQTNDVALSLYAVLFALNRSEYGGPSAELARNYANIAVILGLFGPRSIAEAYLERAQNVAEIVAEPANQAAVNLSAGLYHLDAGQLEDAQRRLDQALQLSENLGNRRLWGDSLGLQARTTAFRGDLAQADAYYKELSGPRSGVMLHRVWADVSRATIAVHQSRLDKAEKLLNKVLRSPGASPEPQQMIKLWGTWGLIHFQRGDYPAARQAADQGLDIIESANASAYTLFDSMATVAEVYLRLWEAGKESAGDPADLAASARRLCDFLEKSTTPTSRPVARLYRGWCEWLSGNQKRSFATWRKGLVEAARVGLPHETGRIHHELGRRLPPGDPDRQHHLQQAQTHFERIGLDLDLEQA